MTELQASAVTTKTTHVVVCVATHHRPEALRRLLSSLAAVELDRPDGPIRLTVIVADNGDDRAAELVHDDFAPDAPFECIYLHEPRRGFVYARNAVLERAPVDADWVAFLDDDEEVDPLWLTSLLEAADHHRADVVAGAVVAVCDEPIDDWRLDLRTIDQDGAPTGTPITHAAGGNLLVRRSMLDAIRFDERFNRSGGEDGMITLELAAAGASMVWCREAVVRDHLTADDLATGTILRRELQGSQTFARAEHLTRGRTGHRFIAASARVVQGLLVLALGLITFSPSRRVAGAITLARGAGALMGIVPIRLRAWPSSPTETGLTDGSAPGGLRRAVTDTGWNGIGQVVTAVSGLLVFASLTQLLNAATFGVYAGSVAIAGIALGFASFGAPELLMRAVAHRQSTAIDAWARGLRVTLLTTAVVLVLLVVPARLLVPQVATWVVLLLAAAEFVNFALNKTNAAVFYAERDFLRGNVASASGDVTKAVAALGLLVTGRDSLEAIAIAFAAASALSVLIGTWLVLHRHGRPAGIQKAGRTYVGQGLALAAGQASASINSSVDQTLLVRAGFERDAGLYGVAVRLMQYSLIPARAWLSTTYPEYFNRGTAGLRSVIAFAGRAGRPLVAWALGVGVVLFVGAPAAEQLLGDSYTGSATVIAAIAGLPLLLMLRSIMSDVLVGSGRFGTRSGAIAVTALVNVVLNLALIPDHGWRGAVVATYASEVLLLVILGAVIARAVRLEDLTDPAPAAGESGHGSR
ncbi:MAG: glycosyltransferase [Acidimicrobiia bacterium]|nr:glycosyltransferase [Acidimicrobiia bacterium]